MAEYFYRVFKQQEQRAQYDERLRVIWEARSQPYDKFSRWITQPHFSGISEFLPDGPLAFASRNPQILELLITKAGAKVNAVTIGKDGVGQTLLGCSIRLVGGW